MVWRLSPGVGVLVLYLAWVSPSAFAADWPQWRGPESNGVGAMPRAPERWSATESIVWRAAIEGHGISSPVVSGNRVYLTTAITEHVRSAPRLAADYLAGAAAVLAMPVLMRTRWRLETSHNRSVRTLDSALFLIVALIVVAFATLMAIGPPAVNDGLGMVRDAGIELGRRLGRAQTNFSFLEWNEGTRHNTWIISTAMALASLALIPFLFPARSIVRLAGGLLLFAGIALAKAYVPWAASYGDRYPTGALIILYSPVALVGLWHVLVFVVGRKPASVSPPAAHVRLLLATPAVIALALFIAPNFLAQREMLTRRIVSLDAGSGARVWHTDVFTTPPETISSLNSHATPSPSVGRDSIVAAFGLGVAAVSLEGQLLWSKTFPQWIESSIYGASSSPVMNGNAVFVTSDREFEAPSPSRVIAYSLETGQELWNHTPEFARDGYTTPIIHHDGGRALLLTLTARTLVGYDAATGAIAWRLTIPMAQPVPSLISEGGRLYVTGGKGGGDGFTGAYQLKQDAPPDELWTSPRNPADVASPVLYKGRLYTISSTGIMVCYDAATGRVIWRHRLAGSGLGVFYASLVAADDKIYAARSNGTTYVVAADDAFRLISESTLPEEIFASPAFAGNCLFLRTTAALYCIGSKG